MAVARDQLLAKAFLFPQEQQVAQGRQASQRQAGLGGLPLEKQDEYFGIPKPKDGFQYTGDMRSRVLNYYKNLAAAKQYAREQWTVYGNDVTNPDPTREDSILAAEAFKAALGNLQTEADEMQQSQEMLKPAVQLANQNKYAFAPGAFDQPYAQVAGTPQAGQTMEVDPLVQFVGQQAGKDFTNYGQYGQAQQAVSQLEGAVTDPRSQIAAGAITPDYTPRADADGGGTAQKSVFEFLKRVSAVSRGVSDYKISSTYVDPATNEALAGTKEFNDAFEGIDRKTGKEVKGVIQEVLRNPNTGAMYLKISTQPDLLPVSMTEFTYGISKANPKYPGVDKISSYVGEFGASDMAGNIQPEKFLEKKALEKATAQEQTLKQEGAVISKQVQDVIDTIEKVQPSGGFGRFFGVADGVELDSKLGKMKFRKNDDGTFDLVNRGDVIPTTKDYPSAIREKAFTNITPEALAQMVRQYNIRPLKSKTETVEIDPDI